MTQRYLAVITVCDNEVTVKLQRDSVAYWSHLPNGQYNAYATPSGDSYTIESNDRWLDMGMLAGKKMNFLTC